MEHGQKPPPTPSGKLMSIKIQMLDDTQEAFEVPQRAPGKVLLDAVCNHLNLVEGDYFGLEFPDHKKITVWLDLLKPIVKQIRSKYAPCVTLTSAQPNSSFGFLPCAM